MSTKRKAEEDPAPLKKNKKTEEELDAEDEEHLEEEEDLGEEEEVVDEEEEEDLGNYNLESIDCQTNTASPFEVSLHWPGTPFCMP